MRTLQDITLLHKLNGILKAHNRTVVSDGSRMLTLIHKPENGKPSITRHPDIPAIVKETLPLDSRLTQFVSV